MTNLNMDLKDLTRGQKIAFLVVGIGLLVYGYQTAFGTPYGAIPPAASPEAPSSVDEEATRIANLLGGGSRQAEQVRVIAARYGVAPVVVGDKAAKTAETCRNPVSQTHVFGVLTFVAKIAADDGSRAMTLDDALISYTLMGCPT